MSCRRFLPNRLRLCQESRVCVVSLIFCELMTPSTTSLSRDAFSRNENNNNTEAPLRCECACVSVWERVHLSSDRQADSIPWRPLLSVALSGCARVFVRVLTIARIFVLLQGECWKILPFSLCALSSLRSGCSCVCVVPASFSVKTCWGRLRRSCRYVRFASRLPHHGSIPHTNETP